MQTFYDLPKPDEAALLRSQALSATLRDEIGASDQGILPFSRFMELALYHPTLGYYQTPSFDLGKHGDFITAPEISPLFAACFARQCLEIMETLGESAILELGAGSGRLASDLISELKRFGVVPSHYYTRHHG